MISTMTGSNDAIPYDKLSNKSSDFVNGQLVVLRTTDKNATSPRQSDIFRVIKVEKDGMAITITN